MQRSLQIIASLVPEPQIVTCSETKNTNMVNNHRFEMSIPSSVVRSTGTLELFGVARRCMHDMCWFTPARAYVLGIYAEPALINRASVANENPTASLITTEIPKTFVLYFASQKDSRHIKNGFERSYIRFAAKHAPESPDRHSINELLSIFATKTTVHRNDCISLCCVPGEGILRVSFNGEPEIQIEQAHGLIKWLHWLYLGLDVEPQARYPSMQRELLDDFKNCRLSRDIIDP